MHDPAPDDRTWNEQLADLAPRKLFEIDRRYLITDLFLTSPSRVWTPKELAAALAAQGFELGERPNKVVADVLRAELRRQRVVRVGHGRYRLGRVPDTTRRRIRDRASLRRRRLAYGAQP